MVASKSMGAYGHPLSLTKHAFFVLFMCRGHADVWGHVDTSFVWQSIISLCCVCTGGIQTSSKYMGASKHLSFSSQTQSHFPRLVPNHLHKKKTFTHSFWLNLMMAAILNSAILDSDTAILDLDTLLTKHLLSDSLKNTLTPLWLWLKLIQSDSNSFILTQLDDGSHLEFCHLEFSHLSFSSQTHSHFPRLVPTICTKKLHSHFPPYHLHKKTSLIHSDSTWWWQPSWILPCWIQTPCFLLSDSLKNTLNPLWLWLKLI